MIVSFLEDVFLLFVVAICPTLLGRITPDNDARGEFR